MEEQKVVQWERRKIVSKAVRSLVLNLLFAMLMAWFGMKERSWWYLALTAYYTVLGTTRFGAVLSYKWAKDEEGRFLMRFTGALLMMLAVTLAGLTYMAFSEEHGMRHHQILMITMAIYAFWKITVAIISLVKRTEKQDPILRTLRYISFADALVSIFSLQRSMLVSFEGMTDENIALMNALTGTAVYLLLFWLGLNLMGSKRSGNN